MSFTTNIIFPLGKKKKQNKNISLPKETFSFCHMQCPPGGGVIICFSYRAVLYTVGKPLKNAI